MIKVYQLTSVRSIHRSIATRPSTSSGSEYDLSVCCDAIELCPRLLLLLRSATKLRYGVLRLPGF